MEERWKQIMAAVFLSILLPQMVLFFGSKAFSGSPAAQVPNTQETTQTTIATNPRQEGPCLIRVLDKEGALLEMDLEEYTRGVVLAEMSAYSGDEALKAQAIAARTYALRRCDTKDRHSIGAVCMRSTCCQAWISDEDYIEKRGTQKLWQRIADAVAATSGLVVTYEGKLAETTYFSCSGGRTESAKAVWKSEIPYLQSVLSPGEEAAKAFSQTFYFTKTEFFQLLGRELSGKPSQWIGSITYTEGGGIATIDIGGVTYSGTQLRSLLKLPSTAIQIITDQEGIQFYTRGHGHRVGMSQYGAQAMAEAGCLYSQILAHYYPGTRIDKWENIG